MFGGASSYVERVRCSPSPHVIFVNFVSRGAWNNHRVSCTRGFFVYCANSPGFDHLNSFMTEDPIYEALQNLYCKVESKSETEVFVPDTEWNQASSKQQTPRNTLHLYP